MQAGGVVDAEDPAGVGAVVGIAGVDTGVIVLGAAGVVAGVIVGEVPGVNTGAAATFVALETASEASGAAPATQVAAVIPITASPFFSKSCADENKVAVDVAEVQSSATCAGDSTAALAPLVSAPPLAAAVSA